MLDRWPWKLLRVRSAINKPPSAWFNAVTRFLCTFTVRYGEVNSHPYVDRPNADGSGVAIVLPPPWKQPKSIQTPEDPRVLERKDVTLVGEANPTRRRTLVNFDASPETGPDPATWSVAMKKPGDPADPGPQTDAALVWVLLSEVIGSAIEDYIDNLEAWPDGTPPIAHTHAEHLDFTDDSHTLGGGVGYVRLSWGESAETEFPRNTGTNNLTHVGGILRQETAVRIGAAAATFSGDADLECQGNGVIRLKEGTAKILHGTDELTLQEIEVTNLAADPPGTVKLKGFFKVTPL